MIFTSNTWTFSDSFHLSWFRFCIFCRKTSLWRIWQRRWWQILLRPWLGSAKEKVRCFSWCLSQSSVKSNMCNFYWCLENRHYGKTKMNQRSSRSHTIFRMVRSWNVYMNMWDSLDFSNFCLFKDSWKSRKEWPSLWRKCRWSHHCVSFSKSVLIS